MIYSDFHMHSDYSSDSSATQESQCEAALNSHLKYICFTDHMDYDFPPCPEGNYLFDMNDYIPALEMLKRRYSDRLEIMTGVELGLMPSVRERCEDLTDRYSPDLDFIIGSSHLVHGEDPYEPSYWWKHPGKEGIDLYFRSIDENLDIFRDFSVYGHLDYCVRYIPEGADIYDPNDYGDTIERILRKIISMGKGIEVNTSSLRSGLDFVHPHMKILKLYRKLGGEIVTVGSDAHRNEDVSADFHQAEQALKKAGFSSYCIFRHQKPVFISLDN